jgi:serpin B
LEFESKLNNVLTDMGMGIAFDDQLADFMNINQNGGLYISEVKHKTYVDVNEEGTEAAAVTSVGIGLTSAPPTFTINRPFIFVIRERFSNTILFMGKIEDPAY